MHKLRGQVAVVGIGETGLGKAPGFSSMALCAEAGRLALEDAGLRKEEIDGLITTDSYVRYHNRHAVQLAQYMGLSADCRYVDTMTSGSAVAGGQGLHYAAALIASGLCECVLVACGDNIRTEVSRDHAVQSISENYEREFEVPYGPIVASRYAFVAHRFMAEYGVTREQLSHVAVSTRQWALKNPNAQMKTPITVADVANSPIISTPLHKLDCSLVSDGGGALLVTSAERARSLRKEPVYIYGMGTSYGTGAGLVHDSITQQANLVSYGCDHSAGIAYDMAAARPADVDAVYLYDCFSINVLVMLEDLGFCERGTAGQFVASGAIAPGGSLPVNTHGGLLSYCHPGKPGGIFMLIEAVKQLRAEAGDRQLADCSLTLAQGHGAHAGIHVTTILGNGAALSA